MIRAIFSSTSNYAIAGASAGAAFFLVEARFFVAFFATFLVVAAFLVAAFFVAAFLVAFFATFLVAAFLVAFFATFFVAAFFVAFLAKVNLLR
jgi:hypothetical protein